MNVGIFPLFSHSLYDGTGFAAYTISTEKISPFTTHTHIHVRVHKKEDEKKEQEESKQLFKLLSLWRITLLVSPVAVEWKRRKKKSVGQTEILTAPSVS